MRHRHWRVCFYAAALLDLVIDCDDGCTVLRDYPLRRLDRMTAVGFNDGLVTTDKQAPDQERNKGDSKGCANQPRIGPERSGGLLFFIHLNSAVRLATQRQPQVDMTDDIGRFANHGYPRSMFQSSDPVPRPRQRARISRSCRGNVVK